MKKILIALSNHKVPEAAPTRYKREYNRGWNEALKKAEEIVILLSTSTD